MRTTGSLADLGTREGKEKLADTKRERTTKQKHRRVNIGGRAADLWVNAQIEEGFEKAPSSFALYVLGKAHMI